MPSRPSLSHQVSQAFPPAKLAREEEIQLTSKRFGSHQSRFGRLRSSASRPRGGPAGVRAALWGFSEIGVHTLSREPCGGRRGLRIRGQSLRQIQTLFTASSTPAQQASTPPGHAAAEAAAEWDSWNRDRGGDQDIPRRTNHLSGLQRRWRAGKAEALAPGAASDPQAAFTRCGYSRGRNPNALT